MSVLGPFIVSVKTSITLGDKVAEVDFQFGPGKIPTREDVVRAMGVSLEAVGDGGELRSPEDFFGDRVREKFGQRGKFATPADWDYDHEKLAIEARAAAAATDEDSQS